MPNIILILLLLPFLSIVLCDNCNPLYPRQFFTQTLESLIIKFDTDSQCDNSYATVVQEHRIEKFYCRYELLSITQSTTFQTYIHTCNININSSLSSYNYTIFGSENARSNSFLVWIPQRNETMNLAVIGDWGTIETKPYEPLRKTLNALLSDDTRKIHGLLINGDIAYELYSDECQQYKKFMEQLSQVSPFWPMISVVGNHEHLNLSWEIYLKSFQAFGMSYGARVQKYSFWNFHIIAYDPYLQVYGRATPEEYLTMKQKLQEEVEQARKKQESFVMVASHYPLACSGDGNWCKDTMKTMPDLFDWMSRNQRVDFYLGAHMHQYERVYPFKNGDFMMKQAPYYRGEMPSLIEGVGGTDKGIVDWEYEPEFFSITHTRNQTGLGIMQIENINSFPTFTYEHIVTKPTKTLFDRVTILPLRRRKNLKEQ